MEGQPRCIKCGRILNSAASIARGMGSKCAGIGTVGGRAFHMKIGKRAGKNCQSVGGNIPMSSVFPQDLPTKPLRRRADISRMRAERRKLFDERKTFQCGVLTRTYIPLIYVPAGDGTWKENHSGRSIPHEALQNYLKRYNLI